MLTIVTAIITENTILPPLCQPRVLLIYQPLAKHKIERTNQTAKFFSSKLNMSVSRKSDAKIRTPNRIAVA
jgi:hypothetical protein